MEPCDDCTMLEHELWRASDHYVGLIVQHDQMMRDGKPEASTLDITIKRARRRRNAAARLLFWPIVEPTRICLSPRQLRRASFRKTLAAAANFTFPPPAAVIQSGTLLMSLTAYKFGGVHLSECCCPQCGCPGGTHASTCICPHCGHLGGTHAINCYCPECGVSGGAHVSSCACPQCGRVG